MNRLRELDRAFLQHLQANNTYFATHQYELAHYDLQLRLDRVNKQINLVGTRSLRATAQPEPKRKRSKQTGKSR
jgi:hypothetical protein